MSDFRGIPRCDDCGGLVMVERDRDRELCRFCRAPAAGPALRRLYRAVLHETSAALVSHELRDAMRDAEAAMGIPGA